MYIEINYIYSIDILNSMIWPRLSKLYLSKIYE
jgi:hypothetical protein